MCRNITWAAQFTELATTPGLPAALSSIPWVTKNGPNMYGWNCSPASSSQTRPRQICKPRRPGTVMPGLGV